MNQVVKHALNVGSRNILHMPVGSRALRIVSFNNQIELLSLCDFSQPSTPRAFILAQSGQMIVDAPVGEGYPYLGSVLLNGTEFHGFEVSPN